MKPFSHYETKGQKYFEKSLSKKRDIPNSITALTLALENYRTARKIAWGELDRSRLSRKINDTHKEIDSLKASSGLQDRFYLFFSFLALVFALFFISFNLTGNVVGESALNDNVGLGICFFLCGLVFTFLYAQIKKRF